jgi:predicted DNA-binding transcriptional regulator AlpA
MPASKKHATITQPRQRRSRNRPVLLDDGGQVYSIVGQIRRHRGPMSVADLAPILGHSDDVLYRMVREGKIPQLIVPGSTVIRFDPASIVYWLCKHNPLLHQVQKAS